MERDEKNTFLLILSTFLFISGFLLFYQKKADILSIIAILSGGVLIVIYLKRKQKQLMNLDDMYERIKRNEKLFSTYFEKLTFFDIFLLWIMVVSLFGIMYYLFAGTESHLVYGVTGQTVTKLSDHIYYSFIAATSTGFGDIIPIGLFKTISIFEIIFGLVLLAFVTSKIISIKQNLILTEIYEISFNEKVSRLRSSLIFIRQHLNKLINEIEHKKHIHERDLSIYLAQFQHALLEVSSIFPKDESDHFKKIEAADAEIIIDSTLRSFEKIHSLLQLTQKKHTHWSGNCEEMINKCLILNDDIFMKLQKTSILPIEELEELILKKNEINKNIKKFRI